MSSGDFGRAYLTERWASRFVTELFRQYTVCFVGYSLNDPVLKYMVDAISADRSLGERTPEVFAIAPYKKGKQKRVYSEWESKGVVPVLYLEDKPHSRLHKTLKVWADDYRVGINGKLAIIRRYGPTLPARVIGADQVSRVLWALADRSGLPAKTFGELNPPAPIEWLKTLSDELYSDWDLPRFGVPADATEKLPRKFSLLARPTSYLRSQWTTLAGHRANIASYAPRLDRIAFELAKWLANHHLHEPDLLQWVSDRGGCLHPQFADFVRDQLRRPGLPSAYIKVWRAILWNSR